MKHLSVYEGKILCKLFVTGLWNEHVEFYMKMASFPFECSDFGFLFFNGWNM